MKEPVAERPAREVPVPLICWSSLTVPRLLGSKSSSDSFASSFSSIALNFFCVIAFFKTPLKPVALSIRLWVEFLRVLRS